MEAAKKLETSSQNATFSGSFEPPAIGETATPLRISGKGKIEVSGSHLHVSGFHSKSNAKQTAIFLGVLFGVVGVLTYIKMNFFPDLPTWVTGAIGGGLGVALIQLNKGQGEHETKPLNLTLSKEQIKKVHLGKGKDAYEGFVFIDVKKNKPKGRIYFRPEGQSPELVLESLLNFSKS